MNEIETINRAVDDFADAIKARMAEKHDTGYRGWDGAYPESELLDELAGDVEDVAYNVPLKHFVTSCRGIMLSRLVDVGARAMMLWYRSLS